MDDLDDLDDEFVLPSHVTSDPTPPEAHMRMTAPFCGHRRTYCPLTLFALCKHGCPGSLLCNARMNHLLLSMFFSDQ